MKEILSNEDIEIIRDLDEKNVGTGSLRKIFSKINQNPRFKEDEKDYLKRILTTNINNAFKKKHGN